MSLEPLMEKMQSFSDCHEVDGNDIASLLNTFSKVRETRNKPSFIKVTH